MLAHLQNKFDLKPELGLGDIYLRARRLLDTPFSLKAMNSGASTNEQRTLAMLQKVLANQIAI